MVINAAWGLGENVVQGTVNPDAVKFEIIRLIKAAHKAKKEVRICRQALSDYPEFAAFLVQQGIDSISLFPIAEH